MMANRLLASLVLVALSTNALSATDFKWWWEKYTPTQNTTTSVTVPNGAGNDVTGNVLSNPTSPNVALPGNMSAQPPLAVINNIPETDIQAEITDYKDTVFESTTTNYYVVIRNTGSVQASVAAIPSTTVSGTITASPTSTACGTGTTGATCSVTGTTANLVLPGGAQIQLVMAYTTGVGDGYVTATVTANITNNTATDANPSNNTASDINRITKEKLCYFATTKTGSFLGYGSAPNGVTNPGDNGGGDCSPRQSCTPVPPATECITGSTFQSGAWAEPFVLGNWKLTSWVWPPPSGTSYSLQCRDDRVMKDVVWTGSTEPATMVSRKYWAGSAEANYLLYAWPLTQYWDAGASKWKWHWTNFDGSYLIANALAYWSGSGLNPGPYYHDNTKPAGTLTPLGRYQSAPGSGLWRFFSNGAEYINYKSAGTAYDGNTVRQVFLINSVGTSCPAGMTKLTTCDFDARINVVCN